MLFAMSEAATANMLAALRIGESERGCCDHLGWLTTGRGGDAAIASATAGWARLTRAQGT
jgi:hypothetical protein